ncbi:hypothetical protein [Williamwhitmania taraxaci]|nr:hypothetical protein [Williamwhitmania taraxaci]
MKFLHKFASVAWWLLRSSILLFVVLRYLQPLRGMNFSSISFYVSLFFIASALLIFIGGFYKQGGLARAGAFLLCLVGGYSIFMNINSSLDYLSILILLTSIGLVFLTRKDNV